MQGKAPLDNDAPSSDNNEDSFPYFRRMSYVRLLGTLRRECLDFVIPLTAHHVQRLLAAWAPHYNHGRPHMALGPGIPKPPPPLSVTLHAHQHRLPAQRRVVARSVVGGLHHEYGFAAQVA